jgi:uncharacterized membrane protein (UPF0127 family)
MSLNKIPTLNVTIADTPEKQARGLMFVKNMPKDDGMLFVFGRKQNLSFWGENTYIPLDIAFVDDDGRIQNIEVIDVLSRKSVQSKSACKYAIEANLGYFEKNGIRIGDYAIIDKKQSKISFVKRKSKELTASIKFAQQEISDEIMTKYPTLDKYFEYLDSQEKNKQEDKNLPTISQDELGQYIEDSIQDQKEMQEQEGLPEYVPPTIQELEPKSVDELEKEIPKFDNISDAFNWGLQNKQVMKISYQTISKKKGLRYFGNNLITRYIEPHGRFTSRPDDSPSHQILVTYDETVGGIRAFRMQNVREFSFVGRKFNPKFRIG